MARNSRQGGEAAGPPGGPRAGRKGSPPPPLPPLVAGLVHDVGNLLLAIGWSAAALARRPELAGETRQGLVEIRELAERAGTLLRFFRDLHRTETAEPSAVDLGTLISDALGTLRRLVGEDVALAARLDPACPAAWLDPGRAGRILVVLLAAGRDLLPARGGELTLETAAGERTAEAGAARVGLRVRVRPSPRGPGAESTAAAGAGRAARVPARVARRLGELRRLAEGVGGRSSAPSLDGEEGALEVWLPAAAAGAGAEEPPALAVPATVLLVEDDPAVRKVVAKTLRATGCSLLEASGGDEALALAVAEGGRVDLLVTDVVLPGVGGAELAARLAALVPGLKVLLISGYPDEHLARAPSLPAGTGFLAKPFSAAELVAKIRQLLGA